MNKTIAEATLDFHQMIETRVSVVMRESTDVVDKLKNKYLRVVLLVSTLSLSKSREIYHHLRSLEPDQSTQR